jgi:hypothetical protein
MDSCLKLFPRRDKLYIEFIPDEYVKIQPINVSDFKDKIVLFKKTIADLNTYSKKTNTKQIIILDCDKCVNIYKLNLVFFARGVSVMAKLFENVDMLEEVRVIHSSSIIKTLYSSFKRFIPQVISDLISIY